jgi:hypothetical protein
MKFDDIGYEDWSIGKPALTDLGRRDREPPLRETAHNDSKPLAIQSMPINIYLCLGSSLIGTAGRHVPIELPDPPLRNVAASTIC